MSQRWLRHGKTTLQKVRNYLLNLRSPLKRKVNNMAVKKKPSFLDKDDKGKKKDLEKGESKKQEKAVNKKKKMI